VRSYQRRTLVKKEGWPLVDEWYWCPKSVIDKRVETEKTRIERIDQRSGGSGTRRGTRGYWEFLDWQEDQYLLESRLAHACQDGRIRAASGWGVETFQHVGGIVKIYGKCRFCDEPLSDGIKTIIMMDMMETEL
jgi:hypothetical protein